VAIACFYGLLVVAALAAVVIPAKNLGERFLHALFAVCVSGVVATIVLFVFMFALAISESRKPKPPHANHRARAVDATATAHRRDRVHQRMIMHRSVPGHGFLHDHLELHANPQIQARTTRPPSRPAEPWPSAQLSSGGRPTFG
jgi:hypothetical protein